MQRFYICPHVRMDIITVFFLIFRFYSRKSLSQQKLAKNYSFYNTFRLKSLTHFTNLSSTDIENNTLPQHSQHSFLTLKIFQQTCFCLVSKKSICTAPFFDAQELYSWSTLKANVFIFLYISVRTFLFQRHSKILYDGVWVGWKVEISLRRLTVWAL